MAVKIAATGTFSAPRLVEPQDRAGFKKTFPVPFCKGISGISQNFGSSLLRTEFRNRSGVLLYSFYGLFHGKRQLHLL